MPTTKIASPMRHVACANGGVPRYRLGFAYEPPRTRASVDHAESRAKLASGFLAKHPKQSLDTRLDMSLQQIFHISTLSTQY